MVDVEVDDEVVVGDVVVVDWRVVPDDSVLVVVLVVEVVDFGELLHPATRTAAAANGRRAFDGRLNLTIVPSGDRSCHLRMSERGRALRRRRSGASPLSTPSDGAERRLPTKRPLEGA